MESLLWLHVPTPYKNSWQWFTLPSVERTILDTPEGGAEAARSRHTPVATLSMEEVIEKEPSEDFSFRIQGN